MRPYGIDLTKRIEELCSIYKRYISINDDSMLNVIIYDSFICLKLFKDMELVDEFEINFDIKEIDIYNYISVLIIRLLFDERKIFDGMNKIYNKIDNPSLKLEILDDNILDIVIMMFDSNKVFDMVCKNLGWRFYPRKFMKNLDERLILSRKLIRMDDVKW